MAIFRPEGEDDGAVEHPNKRCKLIQTLQIGTNAAIYSA